MSRLARRPFGPPERVWWQNRYGSRYSASLNSDGKSASEGPEIEQLRKALRELIGKFAVALPDCLPILGHGLFSKPVERRSAEPTPCGSTLPALLSKVLFTFAVEFEREHQVSLSICANVLRVLREEGIRVRDLPILSGVSKEGIALSLGFLSKKELVAVEDRIARLTTPGLQAQTAYQQLLAAIEERWKARYGKQLILGLRKALEPLMDRLFLGLKPYPEGWRASVREPQTLPHYPMVLHRGGFPDGS